MHVARIQNCPEAHSEQLRIEDCSQKTKFVLVLFFRVQDSHLEAFGSLSAQLFHFAVLPPPSTQWAPASVPGALQNTHSMQNSPKKLIHFVLGAQNSRNMIGGIWHTSHAALPLLACMLQGFKIVQKPIQSS
jgi:hypothetical protein